MNKVIIVVLIAVLGFGFYLYSQKNRFELHFLDVGQGDAILGSTPDGRRIVIDGGPDNLLLSQLAEKLPWHETEIDYLVVSHWHDDHMMGFVELLEKYRVKNILVTAHQPDHLLYNVFVESIKAKNLQLQIVKAGESFVLSDDLYFRILLADSHHEDFNENSIVIKLSYKNRDFLFTGDLGIEGEEKLLKMGFDLSADYLKVGHHGSKYSSSDKFLQAVGPEICIIQSGQDNKFGHPHQEVIENLEEVGCQIRDTQDEGVISYYID